MTTRKMRIYRGQVYITDGTEDILCKTLEDAEAEILNKNISDARKLEE